LSERWKGMRGINIFKFFGVQLSQDKETNNIYSDGYILKNHFVVGDPDIPVNNDW
jgi:hypothetical protein